MSLPDLNRLRDRSNVLGNLITELYEKIKEIDSIIETIDIITDENEYRLLLESIEEFQKDELYSEEELQKLNSNKKNEKNQ